MEDYQIRQIQEITNKSLTYNKDINQHIERCKISIEIINHKEDTINILRRMLARKDERIRRLEENNLILQREKLVEINELRKVITEQYKIISNSFSKNG